METVSNHLQDIKDRIIHSGVAVCLLFCEETGKIPLVLEHSHLQKKPLEKVVGGKLIPGKTVIDSLVASIHKKTLLKTSRNDLFFLFEYPHTKYDFSFWVFGGTIKNLNEMPKKPLKRDGKVIMASAYTPEHIKMMLDGTEKNTLAPFHEEILKIGIYMIEEKLLS